MLKSAISYIPQDPDWLRARTILLVRAGSHAYGTATKNSDLDVRGVAIPPASYFHGTFQAFEQRIGTDPDLVIYDVRKFVNLAADCNPSILETLFVDESDLLVWQPAGQRLREAGPQFLSRKARHTFSGYAISQLKRIQTHKRWLMNPPTHQPTRTEFGLPERRLIPKEQLGAAEAEVRKLVDSWNLDLDGLDDARRLHVQGQLERVLLERSALPAVERATELLGFETNFLQYMEAERKYKKASDEWEQFTRWQRERNPARAELEAKHGYDTKHAAQLVRLMRMGKEILTTGKVQVRRPDAEELLAIRAGAWTYEQVVEFAERSDAELASLEQTSPLPWGPDKKALDALCVSLVEDAIGKPMRRQCSFCAKPAVKSGTRYPGVMSGDRDREPYDVWACEDHSI